MVIKKHLYQKIKNKAPKEAGVYVWKDKIGNVLYVGKAVNLKNRLLNYTKKEKDLFPKTVKFLKLAESVSWIVVRNELEAILLEMNLIRTLKPKYNIVSKDDKRPLFILFTNDKFPRIKTERMEIAGKGDYVGPFPSAYKLRGIMKRLRRIFPYCSCSDRRKKACLYYDLGLCLGITVEGQDMADSQETLGERKKEYKKNIRNLKMFLSGNIDKVVKILTKEMRELSEKQEYEKAQKVKLQIDSINELLTDRGSIAEYLKDDIIKQKLRQSQNRFLANLVGLPKIEKIEGYDIANTSGENSTASMVVFRNGLPVTSEYKKFKIKYVKGPNDPKMIYETLMRRFNHKDWELPDLILVDGGKTQVKAAEKAKAEYGLSVKIIGLAKRHEQIVILEDGDYKIITLPMDSPALTLLRAVRDESHRFTTTYHKKLREKKLLRG